MTLKEAYEKLGLTGSETLKEVQKKVLSLSFIHHPDRKGGSDAKMKEINNALNIIKNPSMADQETPAYDMEDYYNSDTPPSTRRSKNYSSNPFARKRSNDYSSDFFSDFNFFNSPTFNSSAVNTQTTGKSTVFKITEEDLKKKKLTKKIDIKQPCEAGKTCSDCKGSGKIISSVTVGNSFTTQNRFTVSICKYCKGKGTLRTSCKLCERGSHYTSWDLDHDLKEILHHLEEDVLIEVFSNGKKKQIPVIFTFGEEPFIYYVKLPCKGIEERILKDESISFLFMGEKETHKLVSLLKGVSYYSINKKRVYFRISFIF